MKVNLPNPFTFRRGLYVCFLLICCYTNLHAQTINLGLSTRRTIKPDLFGYDMSTTVRNNASCLNTTLWSKLPLLKPKNLRYPAGDFANWYDWKTGWYTDSPYLPESKKNLPKIANKMDDFKLLLAASGASASIIDLNMLTSTLKDQIAMLKHMDSIGMQIKYIELGNEFYIEGDDDNGDSALVVMKYPTPSSYGDTASIWIDSLHKHFPNAMIAAQGNFDKNNDPRRKIWNDSVLAHLDGQHAMTFHFYYATHYDDAGETNAAKLDVNLGDLPDWLYQPFKAWDILETKSLPKVPAGQEIWITEYNMSDHVRPVMGMWAHGLYTATMSLLLLNDSRITKMNCHGVDGMAVYGGYFFSTDGFNFAGGEDPDFVAPAVKPLTTAWGLTAYGNTMTMVGNAIDKKTYASPIVFSPAPQLTAVEDGISISYDGVIGYLFNDNTGSQAIVINLTGVTQSIKTNILFPAGGTYEMRSSTPLKLIATASDVTIASGNLPVTFVLQPYSVTRITSSSIPAAPPVAHIANSGPLTFCEGDSVQLDAGAGYYAYAWSTGATSQKIWVKNSGDYWVHAYAVQGGYYGADTVQVTVNDKPNVPNIVPVGNKKFCAGGSVTLELGDLYYCPTCTYYWPLTGGTGTSTLVTATSNQYLVATNSNGCKASSDIEEITVWPLPKPVVTSVGPSSACYDVDVTLQATTGFNSYLWSNGGWGQTHVFTASGSYSVDVTDGNNCHGISNTMNVTIWEPPNPAVTAVGPTTYCGGVTTSYLTTIQGYTYKWLKGSVIQTGANSQNYTPTATGTYKAKITDTHGCSKTSATGVSVTVNKTPTASVSINGSTNICSGQTRTLTATGNGGSGFTYKWKKNGSYLSGATNKTYVCSTAGSFSCVITNSTNCTATSNTITTTANCKEESVTANGGSSLLLYPNPSSGIIHLKLMLDGDESGTCTVEIRNLLGQAIYAELISYTHSSIEESLNISGDLPDGTYFVFLYTRDKGYHSELLIKK
jgi:hypothetical protein